jgi:hypothetical protein
MTAKVRATKQVPMESRKLASLCWRDFPSKGDVLESVLIKDPEGNYFVREQYNWSNQPFLIPKSRSDAELYYFFYANEIYDEF